MTSLPMADLVAIALRALAFAAALAAAGVPIFVWLFGVHLDRSARGIRSTVIPVAAAAFALTIMHALVEPARLAGAWSGVLDRSLQALLLSSDFGTTLAVRALGLLTIAAAGLRPGRRGDGIALIGAALVIASFAFMGHTAADDQRWLLAPLLIVHLTVIAFWFGSLWPLAAVARYEDGGVAGAVIGRFSKVAAWAVPVIFIVGVSMAIVLLPGLSSLRTPYGLSLLAKVAGFAILMGLAAINKWRLGPKVALGDRRSVSAFRFAVAAEWLLILAVVTLTAAMTALFSVDL